MTVTSPRSVLSPRHRNESPEHEDRVSPSHSPESFQFNNLVPSEKNKHRSLGQRDTDHASRPVPKHPYYGPKTALDWLAPSSCTTETCAKIVGDSQKLRHGKHVRVEVNGQWVNAKVLAATSLFVTLKFAEDGSIATVPLDRTEIDVDEPAVPKPGKESWVQLAVQSPSNAHTPKDTNNAPEPAEATSSPTNAVAQEAQTTHGDKIIRKLRATPTEDLTIPDWNKEKVHRNISWVRKQLPKFNAKKFNANIRYVQKLLQSYGAKFELSSPTTPESKRLFGDRHQFAFCVRSPTATSPAPTMSPRSPSTGARQDAY